MRPSPTAPFYQLRGDGRWWTMSRWTQVEQRPQGELEEWHGGDDHTPIVHAQEGRFWVWEEAFVSTATNKRVLWAQVFDDVVAANPEVQV